MIDFARAHRFALWTVFCAVAVAVVAIFILYHVSPRFPGESWGWVVVFGAFPWSIPALAVPGWLGVPILAVGLGFNATAAILVL